MFYMTDDAIDQLREFIAVEVIDENDQFYQFSSEPLVELAEMLDDSGMYEYGYTLHATRYIIGPDNYYLLEEAIDELLHSLAPDGYYYGNAPGSEVDSPGFWSAQ